MVATGSSTRIEPGAILVAVGAPDQLIQIERLVVPIRRTGAIVVAGYGTVGRKVVDMLRDAGETTVIIDQQPMAGVDVVGNVLEHATLSRANVCAASAVILALSNDSEGVFATAVVRDYAPEVPLIVRVNRVPNVARLYQAGADFALSVGQMAGEILAYHLFDEQAISIQPHIKFIRLAADALVGLHPWQSAVQARTGVVVIAVRREGETRVMFTEDFRIRAGDLLFACGTEDSSDRS